MNCLLSLSIIDYLVILESTLISYPTSEPLHVFFSLAAFPYLQKNFLVKNVSIQSQLKLQFLYENFPCQSIRIIWKLRVQEWWSEDPSSNSVPSIPLVT